MPLEPELGVRYGLRTADMAERLGLSPSPCEKLVPFLGMHVEEGVDGKRLKFAGRQGLEAAQGLPLRLQPLHGGLHGAQAQRAEAAQDGGERGCQEGHPERHLRPLLHEPRQVQEHERLRGPGQVRAGCGRSVTNFELQINDSEGFLAFVETLKTDRKACMSVPTQVDSAVKGKVPHHHLLPDHDFAMGFEVLQIPRLPHQPVVEGSLMPRDCCNRTSA